MRTLLLDYKKFDDKKTFHPYMKKKLRIEGYFGDNLDAMWDAMSYLKEDLRLCVFDWEEYEETDSETYSKAVIETLRELSKFNNHISLEFVSISRLT
jgi:RNAse (barnase) inhibitor barstar